MKRLINLFPLLFILINISGCKKFLEENPKSFLTPENFYKTASDLNAGLNVIYRAPQDRYSGMWAAPHYFEWGTDEQEITDKNPWPMHNQIARLNTTFNASSDVPSWFWNDYLYNYVKNINFLLSAIKTVDAPAEDKNKIEAQARALRALIYFDGVRIFNDIPLLLTANTNITEINSMSRNTAADVYKAIIDDLNFAISNLPNTWSGADNVGRITSGAAAALLAKVHLTMAGAPLNQKNHLEDARNILTDFIINKKYGSQYFLLPNYSDIYNESKQPHSEGVWTINFTRGTFGQGSDLHTNYAPLELYYANGIGLSYGGGWSNGIPTEKFYDSYDKIKDKRFAATYWTSTADFPNEYNSLLPKDANGNPQHITFYRPHIKKFREPTPNNNSEHTGIDHYIIRYADVLLMYSEVLNELNGSNKEVYINQVRTRAGLDPLQANLSQSDFRERIIMERGWELAHEGDRRFDLMRWGIYITRTPLWNPQVKGNIQANKHEFWPIPQSERDINKNLTQNPGY